MNPGRHIRILLTAIGLLLSLAKASAQEPVVKFWTWFQLNENKLNRLAEEPVALLEELQAPLLAVDSGLHIEIDAANHRSITFTADGDERLFPVVQELLQKAPLLANWKFTAFRQRLNSSDISTLQLKMGDRLLGVDQLFFFPVAEKDSLDIIIYLPGLTTDNYMEMAYQCLILLDHLLGEYDCVMKVRHYDFHLLPRRKEELVDLKPLKELPAFVDRFHIGK